LGRIGLMSIILDILDILSIIVGLAKLVIIVPGTTRIIVTFLMIIYVASPARSALSYLFIKFFLFFSAL